MQYFHECAKFMNLSKFIPVSVWTILNAPSAQWSNVFLGF